jgi:hypothetical protein
VTNDGLLILADLNALTSLILAGCEQVSDDGLLTLAGLTALTNLNLQGCKDVSGDGLRTLASLTALTFVMCTFIVVLKFFEVMISSPHQPQFVIL